MKLGGRRRGQTFSIDIIIALAIFGLLFTAMERMGTEVEKDRVEWQTVYDLKMVSDDFMTAMVDSTPNGYQYGVSYYDEGMGIDRLNAIDVEAAGGLAPFLVGPTFFSRLMSTEGSLGYGWRVNMYVCKDEDMGVDRDITLPVNTQWFEDAPVPRCVVTDPVTDNGNDCRILSAGYREMDGSFYYEDDELTRIILRNPAVFQINEAGHSTGTCNREDPGGMCLHVTTADDYTPGALGLTQVKVDANGDSLQIGIVACKAGNCPDTYDSGTVVFDIIPDESNIASDTIGAAAATYLTSNRGFPVGGGQHPAGSIQQTMDGTSEVYTADCGTVESRLRVHAGTACDGGIVSFIDYYVASDGDVDSDPATPGTPTWRPVFKHELPVACQAGTVYCYVGNVCLPGEEPTIITTQDANSATATITYTTFRQGEDTFPGATIVANFILTNDCRLALQHTDTFTGDIPTRTYGFVVQADSTFDGEATFWGDDQGQYLTFWDDERGECLLPIVPDQTTCEGALVDAEWLPTELCRTDPAAVPDQAACEDINGVWNDPDCFIWLISDEQTCEAAGNTEWTEDQPDPRCVAVGIDNDVDCLDPDVGGTWVNDECVLAAGDLQACEHLTTAWVWNDPGEGPGGRCAVSSIGMDSAFCEGEEVSGEWDAEAIPPVCVIRDIEDKGSCETFCFNPQYQAEPFMTDPNPDQEGEDEPPEGLANCQSPDFGCISSTQAKYGIVSVNRVVAPRGGRGVGVLNLEVWK